MNKKCLNWNIFKGLNDWNIIALVTQTKNKNSEKDDEEFKTIIRGLATRMSEKILTTMHGAISIDDFIVFYPVVLTYILIKCRIVYKKYTKVYILRLLNLIINVYYNYININKLFIYL